MSTIPKREQDLLALEAVATGSKGTSGWVRSNCPFCPLKGEGPDTHQSWGLYEDTGYWHCFRCNTKGRLGDGPIVEEVEEGGPREYVDPPESFIPLASDDGRKAIVLEHARNYVLSRGLSWRTIEEAGIGACLKGKYGGRIVVPVRTASGKWHGFFARVWLSSAATKAAEAEAHREGRRFFRYLTAPGEWRKHVLFNQAALSVETDEPLGVFEGGFSGFGVWPDCVACLGKPTEAQRALLLQARRPLAICLDGDAWEEGEGLAMWLKYQGKSAGYVHFPPKQDGNDRPPEWVREQMRQCIERAP